MIKHAFLLLSLLLSTPLLATTPVVEAFLADPVELLDEQGKLLHETPKAALPKGPLNVLQYNEELELVQVQLGDQVVWLDTVDLRLNPNKLVKLPCQKMPSSLAADSQNHSTLGFGAGCAKQGQP